MYVRVNVSEQTGKKAVCLCVREGECSRKTDVKEYRVRLQDRYCRRIG